MDKMVKMYDKMRVAPTPYRLGRKYLTVGGEVVKLIKIQQSHPEYQTMACKDNVHRYTSRDFGRVTGTPFETPDPRNLRYPPIEVK